MRIFPHPEGKIKRNKLVPHHSPYFWDSPFSSIQTQEDEPIFLDSSRQAGITNNHQGITKMVGQAGGILTMPVGSI